MIPPMVGYAIFAAVFVALGVSSVLREREVPSTGAIGRVRKHGIARSAVLLGLIVVLVVAAAVVVAIRFQQIAIWE